MAKRRPGRDPEEHSAVNSPHKVKVKHEPKAESATTPPTSDTAHPVEMHVVDVESGVRDHKAKNHAVEYEPNESELTHSESSHSELNQSKASHSDISHVDPIASDSSEIHQEEPKVELTFAGSETLRAQFPKTFETAEKIATDWIHDGRFEGLPLGHPLAQYFAAKGLRKAKEVEKKVMESPVTEKLAMNILTYGMKAQEIINQVKAKVKK